MKSPPATFNARAEDIEKKAIFRKAFKQSRCLIPATGFLEWTGEKTARKPWFISSIDGKHLTFAGLFETWKDRESGETIKSCTIITCAANDFLARIHNRMPVILDQKDWQSWLT